MPRFRLHPGTTTIDLTIKTGREMALMQTMCTCSDEYFRNHEYAHCGECAYYQIMDSEYATVFLNAFPAILQVVEERGVMSALEDAFGYDNFLELLESQSLLVLIVSAIERIGMLHRMQPLITRTCYNCTHRWCCVLRCRMDDSFIYQSTLRILNFENRTVAPALMTDLFSTLAQSCTAFVEALER